MISLTIVENEHYLDNECQTCISEPAVYLEDIGVCEKCYMDRLDSIEKGFAKALSDSGVNTKYAEYLIEHLQEMFENDNIGRNL
jgi:hypothetical protein